MDYEKTEMRKDIILKKLKERGCRITKQRMLILDIILNEKCSCCKEIYYKAIEHNPGIGVSTVYRMVNSLEDIGAISRSDIYKIKYEGEKTKGSVCVIELDDGTFCIFSEKTFETMIAASLKAAGYIKEQKIKKISMNTKYAENDKIYR